MCIRDRVHPLPGRAAWEQLHERAEILPGRQDLLDPDHRDERLGQGEAHPAIALGLDDDQRAGLGDQEVGARDGDLGSQELLPQVQPRGFGEPAWLVGEVVRRGSPDPTHRPPEDLADLRAVAVNGGYEDCLLYTSRCV